MWSKIGESWSFLYCQIDEPISLIEKLVQLLHYFIFLLYGDYYLTHFAILLLEFSILQGVLCGVNLSSKYVNNETTLNPRKGLKLAGSQVKSHSPGLTLLQATGMMNILI